MEVGAKVLKLEKDVDALKASKIKGDEELLTFALKLVELEKELKDMPGERVKEIDDAAWDWKRGVIRFLRRHRVQIGACLSIAGLALLARGEKVEGARRRFEEAGRDLIATMAIVSGVCGAITQFASYSSSV